MLVSHPGFKSDFVALLIGSMGSGSSIAEANAQKSTTKFHPLQWWDYEDGLFNLDDEGRAEKQQFAVAASNILRNFSFMPENEVIMAQHRHCLETLFQCIEDHITGDENFSYNYVCSLMFD